MAPVGANTLFRFNLDYRAVRLTSQSTYAAIVGRSGTLLSSRLQNVPRSVDATAPTIDPSRRPDGRDRTRPGCPRPVGRAVGDDARPRGLGRCGAGGASLLVDHAPRNVGGRGDVGQTLIVNGATQATNDAGAVVVSANAPGSTVHLSLAGPFARAINGAGPPFTSVVSTGGGDATAHFAAATEFALARASRLPERGPDGAQPARHAGRDGARRAAGRRRRGQCPSLGSHHRTGRRIVRRGVDARHGGARDNRHRRSAAPDRSTDGRATRSRPRWSTTAAARTQRITGYDAGGRPRPGRHGRAGGRRRRHARRSRRRLDSGAG